MRDVTFVLLAGGHSSRMGQDKARLLWQGRTFLQYQAEKARALGVGEILVSGYRGGDCPWRVVPDLYPERGPLGGLHACFRAAAHPLCLVLSVDVPLVTGEILDRLVQTQRREGGDVVLACCDGRWEPLIGVYRAELAGQIEALIRPGPASVRRLLQSCDTRLLQLGPEVRPFLQNCNDPAAYAALLAGQK